MKACNVEIVEEHRRCGEVPAREITGTCAHRHKITADACEPCMEAIQLGCLTCWQDGDGHVCQVTFGPAECWCGCGEPVPVAAKSDSRYSKIRGRPVRYVSGHNNQEGAA